MDAIYVKMRSDGSVTVQSGQQQGWGGFGYGEATIFNYQQVQTDELFVQWANFNVFSNLTLTPSSYGNFGSVFGELSKRAIIRAWRDLQAAVRYWRVKNEEDTDARRWKVDPSRIYGMGFSAGAITVLHNLYLDEATYTDARALNGGNPGFFTSTSVDYTFTLTNWSEIVNALMDAWISNPDALRHIADFITEYKTYQTSDIDAHPTYPCIGVNSPCVPGGLSEAEKSTMDDLVSTLDGRLDKGASFSGALAKLEWMSNETNRQIRFVHHTSDAVISATEDEPFSYLGDVLNVYNFATSGATFTPTMQGGENMIFSAMESGYLNFDGEILSGTDKAGGGTPYHRSMQKFGSTNSDESEPKLLYYIDAVFSKDWASTADHSRAEAPISQVAVEPEVVDEPVFKIFPNPAIEELNIVAEITEPGPVIIEWVDMQGRVVAKLERGHLDKGAHWIRLRNPGLAQGVYWLHFKSSSGQRRERIIFK